MDLQILRIQVAACRRHGIDRQTFLSLTPQDLRVLDDDLRKELRVRFDAAERRTAKVVAAIYNNSMLKKKGAKYEASDFLPREKKVSSAEDLKNKFRVLAG